MRYIKIHSLNNARVPETFPHQINFLICEGPLEFLSLQKQTIVEFDWIEFPPINLPADHRVIEKDHGVYELFDAGK